MLKIVYFLSIVKTYYNYYYDINVTQKFHMRYNKKIKQKCNVGTKQEIENS